MKSKLLLIASLALLAGCAKQGPIGPTGEQGPSGTNGSNGINGTVNMKTIIDSTYLWATIKSGVSYEATLSNSNITNADSDNVSVAESSTITGPWLELPATHILNDTDQMGYTYQNGQVSVIYYYKSAPITVLYFKMTVLPPPRSILKKTVSITTESLQN
jgi:hypothetical protein